MNNSKKFIRYIQTEMNISGKKKEHSKTEKENINSKMEAVMMANGETIKWMEKVIYIFQIRL